MKFFEKTDVKEALDNARQDERNLCEIEFDKKKKIELVQINGEWDLKLKEKQAELDSMRLRMKEYEKKEQEVEKQRQRNREGAMLINRILSDLKYFSDKKRNEEIEESQTLNRLTDESENVKRLMVE